MENNDLASQPVGLLNIANERIAQLDESLSNRNNKIAELQMLLTAAENAHDRVREAYVTALQSKDDLQKAFDEEKTNLLTAHSTELETLRAENQALNNIISDQQKTIQDIKVHGLQIAEDLINYLKID